jgi:UDP-4-amino-4,6-dideoxy-N-acetyl-beta-L-altrosamine N-acetyltransferase
MIRFLKLKDEHLEMVMRWRVKPSVTQFMITDVVYSLENQRKWFGKVQKDTTCSYWVIIYGDIPIGLINLAEIDRTNRRCSAGYYIGENDYMNIGAMIPPYLYNYVFKEMGFHKIYGEVFSGNINILKIHSMHGFREVGIYKDHVFKNERFFDVVLIELLSKDWLSKKKYERYIAEFK